MRTVTNRTIVKLQEVEVSNVIANEEIFRINEFKYEKYIELLVALKTEDGTVVATEGYRISGPMFDMIMSASPSFAPNKPLNEYREVDLWVIVDMIREERKTNPAAYS